MPKRKEPEASSPAKNMEHSDTRPSRAPPSGFILALEAPNIGARSLRGRAGGRSGRGGRSGGDTISGSGGRSGGDSMPGRGGKSSRGGRAGGESISSRGGKSGRGRGRGRQRGQETTYHPKLRLPTKQQRNLLLEEKGREIVHIDLATISAIKESSSTSRNNCVALTPEKNIADQGLPQSNPTVMIGKSMADEIEAFANAPAPKPGASTQEDPSIEPAGSDKSDKAKQSLKSLESVN